MVNHPNVGVNSNSLFDWSITINKAVTGLQGRFQRTA